MARVASRAVNRIEDCGLSDGGRARYILVAEQLDQAGAVLGGPLASEGSRLWQTSTRCLLSAARL